MEVETDMFFSPGWFADSMKVSPASSYLPTGFALQVPRTVERRGIHISIAVYPLLSRKGMISSIMV